MQLVQMMKRNNRFLLARVVDEAALADKYIKAHFKIGEVYEYVVCSNFDGKEWNNGNYFGYRYLQSAIDSFNKGYSITNARMTELATLFKDALIEADEEFAADYFDEELFDEEFEFFEIEHEKEEDELYYDTSKVDEDSYGII